jgi:hypothetical protein
MSATTFTGSVQSERSWKHASRIVLVAAAIVVLFAVSFFIGRATGSTTAPHAASITPATSVIARECAQNGQANSAPSHVGRAC